MIRTLKTLGITLGTALALSGVAAAPAIAAPFSVNVVATVASTSGSFSDLTAGTVLSAAIVLDTSESEAFNAITTPSVVPGHEFTSFHEFATADGYSWAGDLVPPTGDGFNADVMGIVVNNNLALDTADTGGLLPTGTYDWIELLGSTTTSICLIPAGCAADEFTPANGEEWTLAIFSTDANWFTDGSVIPDELPASFITLLVGIEIDEFGEEIGFAFATIDEFSSSLPQAEATEISAPATAGLVGLFLIAAARIRRRK